MGKRVDQFIVAENASNELDYINYRLEEISDFLKEIQPAKDGSILLGLSNCGPGCLGCPHASWTVWKRRLGKKDTTYRLVGIRIKDPLNRVKTSGEFAAGAPLVKSLIQEAQELLKKKEKMVKAFSSLKRAVKNSEVDE